MKLTIYLLVLFSLISCVPPQQTQQTNYDPKVEEIELPLTVTIPKDGSSPIAGEVLAKNPDMTMTFNGYNEKQFVKTGTVVNFIYEGIDPENSFILYESTDEGYYLTLVKNNTPANIKFSRLCQTYIVASPQMTNITIDENVRFEQIIWTPRAEGNWEVRIGSTARGCKSEALDRLNKLRNQQYEKKVKETIIK